MSRTIRSFNRYELKYILDHDFALEVMKRLEDYMEPDQHGDAYGNYHLASLYYDTDDYRFYWEKVEGIRFRRKLRIRLYEKAEKLTPDTKVFVEIKQRLDRVTQKRRILLPYGAALRFCSEQKLEQYTSEEKETVDEMLHMMKTYQLKPQCITSYKRRAFNGTQHDPGLRVTFDTNLRYRNVDLDLHSKKIGKFILGPDQCIMEVKVNDRIPYWLTEFVADHNIRLMRISKYCASLEQAEAVPRREYEFAA
ncbi:MAG: polyphosphate polymerase domain-containing protein [Candidatus Peregrinibacteria bacterium]|nr:polyphosphate polymerase domain-containing protein [Candidatus Peregrinibacteria bacterium]